MTESSIQPAELALYKERFEHLRGVAMVAEEGAWQYLLAVNGGGAAAMLAFIGAVPGYRSVGHSYAVLALFMAGLLLVGLARANANLRLSRAIKGWNADMSMRIKGDMEFREMLRRDAARTGTNVLAWSCGFLSLGLFVAGVGLTVWLFMRIVPYAP